MSRSLLHGSWEISSVPDGITAQGGVGKTTSHNPTVYADEKSDVPIVPKKQANKELYSAESVEERGAAKRNTNQSPTSRTQSQDTNVSMGLIGVRKLAKHRKEERFNALLHHITPELLIDSFYQLKRQAAHGVDGMRWHDYEKILPNRVLEVHQAIHKGVYRAKPSRRVMIPKADGRERPLGIACIEDKMVQQAVVTVLNAIYEEDFLGFSYGFRQGRSQHDALDAVYVAIRNKRVNWVLDADISAFFDEIDHEWMIRFLEHRIADKRLIALIRKWLKVGILVDGKRIAGSKGTPQGAVISPLLANVYLHYVLDMWAHQWRGRYAVGDMVVIRYADDSVFGFTSEASAQRFLVDLEIRLAKFGLKVNSSKTRLIEFGRFACESRARKGLGKPETFDFLGFTHCCSTQRKGGFTIMRLTVKKRMRATMAAIKQTLMKRRHEPIGVLGRWLNKVLQGYINYHAVPGNLMRLNSMFAQTTRNWMQALRRRSQRHKMPWERMAKLVKIYLPKLKNCHDYPNRRFFALRTQGKSRMR